MGKFKLLSSEAYRAQNFIWTTLSQLSNLCTLCWVLSLGRAIKQSHCVTFPWSWCGNNMPKLHGTSISFHISWWTNTPDSFLPTLTAVFHSVTFISVFCSPQQSRPTWVVPSWERGCTSYNCPIPDNCVYLELVHFCRYHHHHIQVCIYIFSFKSGQLWTRFKMGGYTIPSGKEDKLIYLHNHIPAISYQRYSNYITFACRTNNNQNSDYSTTCHQKQVLLPKGRI